MFPSFYGIDVSTTAELISASKSPKEICDYIGADSLSYLSVDGLIESIGLDYDAPYSGLCVRALQVIIQQDYLIMKINIIRT